MFVLVGIWGDAKCTWFDALGLFKTLLSHSRHDQSSTQGWWAEWTSVVRRCVRFFSQYFVSDCYKGSAGSSWRSCSQQYDETSWCGRDFIDTQIRVHVPVTWLHVRTLHKPRPPGRAQRRAERSTIRELHLQLAALGGDGDPGWSPGQVALAAILLRDGEVGFGEDAWSGGSLNHSRFPRKVDGFVQFGRQDTVRYQCPLRRTCWRNHVFSEIEGLNLDSPWPSPRLSKAMLDYFDAGNNGGQSYLTQA